MSSRTFRYASLDDMPLEMRARLRSGPISMSKSREPLPALAACKPRRDEEHTQQVVFFNRIRALAANDPHTFGLAVARTYAIPNGGGRSKREAGRLKAEGVRKGVSDIFVSLPRSRWSNRAASGLYIEMKTAKGRVSAEQEAWLTMSRTVGYVAQVCRSADEAVRVWTNYVLGAG